jgi:transcription antitermination factor NusG
MCPSTPLPAWYGVRTRSNYEKVTADMLSAKGYEAYLPIYRARRRWSDRAVERELPLFPGYLFCRFDPMRRLPILTTPGVVSVISNAKVPIPIPEVEISAIRTAIESGFPVTPCAYLKEGQHVRVREGPLEGVEGILIRKKNDWRIVLSVEMLQRSVSIEIDRESVTAI